METIRTHDLGKPDAITAEGEIVLRDKGEQCKFHRYVVHFHNRQDGGYYHGDYCHTIEEANAAFEARVKRR